MNQKIQQPFPSENSAERSEEGARRKQRQKLLERTANSEVGQRRFWKKVKKKGPKDCWEWIGTLREGYGLIVIGGFTFNAHRMSYFFKYQSLPDDLLVCHQCDNTSCVNPAHLFLGTSQENRKDCVQKVRHARGEGQFKHKLTENQVSEIRLRYSQSGVSYNKLADRFKVSKQTIYRVINRMSWNHI